MSIDISRFRKDIEELRFRLKRFFITWLMVFVILTGFPGTLIVNPEEFLNGTYQPLSATILQTMVNYILNSPLIGRINITFFAGTLSFGIEMWFYASFIFSIIFSLPLLIYEIWKFVEPALYDHEKKILRSNIIPIFLCFIIGILDGFFILTPIVVNAMVITIQWFGTQPIITYSDFVSTMLTITIFSGFMLMIPPILYTLFRFRIISPVSIRKYRVYFYIILYIIAAIITPDGAIIGNLVLTLPVILALEIVLILGRKYEK